MLILVHNGFKVTSILNEELSPTTNFLIGNTITKTVSSIIKTDYDGLLVWCYQALLPELNTETFAYVFHHKRVFASFNPTDTSYLPKQIGYIERSYFIKINKTKRFPTWLMSSYVGGINAQVLKQLSSTLNYNVSFDYFLLSISKRCIAEGLFCYSEPKLLQTQEFKDIQTFQASKQELFKFTKQHYKWVWVVFLAWCYAIYEKKTSVFSVLKSLFYKPFKASVDLESIKIQSTKKLVKDKSIDVIIPTIGRKKHLYNVLKDLSTQSHLPKNIIIVEQNPLPNSVSELEYLTIETWPFNIKHTFTNTPGVCNARNIALAEVESEWTFFADDDIRFETHFLERSLTFVETNGVSIINYLCLQPSQQQTYFKMHQTTVFGSGSSLVKSTALHGIVFNTAYEFGFGEDSEFGMQLRYKGEDVVYNPNLKITHLKAPIGGYRIKIKQRWADDAIQPKPSPTVQLLYQTYFTKQQLQGYKLLLFLKQFKAFGYKNFIKFKTNFNNQWSQSVLWSSKLKETKNA